MLARARAAASSFAVRPSCAVFPGLAVLSGIALASALLACGSPGSSGPGSGELAANSGYEGMNFYEANGDEPPSIDSVPLGDVPGSYELVSGEPLPACNVPLGQRATAEPDARATACPPATREMISDFAFTGNPSSVTFGPDSALPGGTYSYGSSLVSDVTDGDWHIRGRIREISGFGLYLECGLVDAAAYRGMAFRVWGRVGDGGVLVFYVGTAQNQVASSWINDDETSGDSADEPPNAGRCIPLGGRYDGTCREARRIVNVTPEPEPTVIQWRDLGDGCPEPSVDPSEITSIAWYFPQPLSGSYDVDIHIDDLRFSDEGPL